MNTGSSSRFGYAAEMSDQLFSSQLESHWMSVLRWHINIHSSVALDAVAGVCVSCSCMREVWIKQLLYKVRYTNMLETCACVCTDACVGMEY